MSNDKSIAFKKQLIFASFFQISNDLQNFLDQYLKPVNLTAKQFMLMIEIGNFGDEGGLLKDISKRSGSSHQNTKQIALKLRKNGYITIEKDLKDKRAIRLRLTQKALQYWQNRAEEDIKMIQKLFISITETNIDILAKEMIKIKENIQNMKVEK